jgi:hypothetical protein
VGDNTRDIIDKEKINKKGENVRLYGCVREGKKERERGGVGVFGSFPMDPIQDFYPKKRKLRVRVRVREVDLMAMPLRNPPFPNPRQE